MLLLWAHVAMLPAVGVGFGVTPAHALAETSLVAVFAASATLTRRVGRHVPAAAATLGLISPSAILTRFSGGLIEMHFDVFVMMVVISLYQSWRPVLLALASVVAHHGVVGMVDPGSVFDHPAAIEAPRAWAGVHGLFILGQSLACLVAWCVNEDALERERGTRGALERPNRELAERAQLEATSSTAPSTTR
jgi:mannitol-specific phosphotransferase system IIBC component